MPAYPTNVYRKRWMHEEINDFRANNIDPIGIILAL